MTGPRSPLTTGPSGADNFLEFVDRCGTHVDHATLLSDFASIVERCGFKYFIMTGLPAYGENVENLLVCNRWPIAWTERYREQQYFLDDPVTKQSFSHTRPFRWQDARDQTPSSRRTLAIEGEAADLGLVDGFAFPILDPTNWQAVVSVASEVPIDASPTVRNMLYLAALCCHNRATELMGVTARATDLLTTREREVLTWAAAGKSYWETSEILAISRATVETHLLHARRKLDAVTTAQAIVRAIRTRQIHV